MRSAVPLGGLGTGSFELRADGTFHEWTIENQSPGGSAKLNKGALNMAVLGVRVAHGNKSEAALLRIHPPNGYPGVESLSYSGAYPVSKLTPSKKTRSDGPCLCHCCAVHFTDIISRESLDSFLNFRLE